MKLAIIADVHANAYALSAVLEDIVARGLGEHTYHLGDLVGYAPYPDETVELIRSFRIQGVAGNYDSTVATAHDHCGCRYEDPEQARLSHESYEWTLRHTRESTRRLLSGLPFRLDLRPGGGHTAGPTVTLVHGTPTLNTVYWHEERPDRFCRKMADVAGARPGDLIAFGHTHIPWHREVDGVHYLNAGSVGRPKDGDWRAGYAIVDMATDRPEVELVRLEYDIDAVCDGIRKSALPDDFAEYLRAGGRPDSSNGGTT
ncbi:MAG: metallophosphoesterase family protein [Longimicrobiales bacterium]|nr:metallophosphoesterase family protein [Longimicrobiales bacterium]